MATDPKKMSEEEINKLLKPFDAIRDKLPVEKDKISAPPEIRSGEWLAAVVEHYPEATIDGPGHSHEVPGRWDEDGSKCEWCKTWTEIRNYVKAANH